MDEELLKFRVGLDADPAQKAVVEFNKKLSETLKLPAKFEKAEKKAFTEVRKDILQSTKNIRKMKDALDDAGKGFLFGGKARKQASELTKYFTDAEKSSKLLFAVTVKNERVIAQLRQKFSKEATKENREAIDQAEKRAKEEIDLAKKTLMSKQSALSRKAGKLGVGETLKKHGDKISKSEGHLAALSSEAIAGDFRKGLSDGASAFLSRDAKGVATAFGDILTGAFKGAGKFALKGAAKGALKLGSFGGAAKAKGTAMGGAGGAALKGIGAFADKAGGLLQIISKMGPILSMTAGLIAGVVKLFLDVDSAGKALNKELLEGASIAETFASAGWDTQAGYNKLETTLQDVKDQAHDVGMNLSMGTSAKDHMAVINVLKREGVTLGGLNNQLEAAKENSDATIRSVKSFSDVTKMAIGYSRIMGVSIEEIGSLQGEMMTELGMSLGETKLEFSRMTDAATESGIAANKFFGIIRGVSADLSLYGSRLKDITKTMKLLGTVMSPKTAQKFMSTLLGAFKGKSMVDRVRTSILAGPNATKAAGKDIAEKMEDLVNTVAKQAGVSVDEARGLLKGGRNAEGKSLMDLQKEGKVTDAGSLREGYLRTERRQRMYKEGGPVGTAAAMEDEGPAAAFETIKAAMLRFGGSKTGKLGDVTGFGSLASEQATGYSTEEQTQAALFESALEDQKNMLKDVFKKKASGGEMSKYEEKILEKMQEQGISIKDNGEIDADTFQIYKTMDQAEEDANKKAEQQLKAAYETGKLSQSMLDKIDVIIDALFNYLYKAMMGIWNAVADANPFEKKEDKKTRMEFQQKGLVKEATELTKKLNDPNISREAKGDLNKKLDSVKEGIFHSIYNNPDIDKDNDKASAQYTDVINGIERTVGLLSGGGGTGGVGGGESVRMGSTTVDTPTDIVKSTDQVSEATAEVAKTIDVNTRKKGIKLDKSFVAGDLGDQMEKSVLDAARVALFEYYMYSDLDRDKVSKAMQDNGLDSKSFGKSFLGASSDLSTTHGALLDKGLPRNAAGGIVSSIGSGLAAISPAPGEGLASIGKGEQIVPAGGGRGSTVNLTVNGSPDMGQWLKPKVLELVKEYDRRKKF